MHYVYILHLSNSDYYVGITSDVENRIKKHNSGQVPSTLRFLPVKLVWYGCFREKSKAAEFEKYLKSSSGKAFRNKRLI